MSIEQPPIPSSVLLCLLADQMSQECELCGPNGGGEIGWDIPLKPFRMAPASPLLMDQVGTCTACKELVDAGDWPQIIARFPLGSAERALVEAYSRHVAGPAGRRSR